MNADDTAVLEMTQGELLSHNLFAYGLNDPINNIDESGYLSTRNKWIIGAVVTVSVIAIVIVATGGTAAPLLVAAKSGAVAVKTKAVLAASKVTTALSTYKAAGGTGVTLGTQFGKLGKLVSNPRIFVDWANTTAHGLQTMSERGVTQKMVETWMKSGQVLQQTGDKFLYITKKGAVVVNKAGQVITAYGSKYFDSTMQEVVKTLFGK